MKPTGLWIGAMVIGLAWIGGCGDEETPQPQTPPVPTTPPPAPTAKTPDPAGDAPLTEKGSSHGPQIPQ